MKRGPRFQIPITQGCVLVIVDAALCRHWLFLQFFSACIHPDEVQTISSVSRWVLVRAHLSPPHHSEPLLACVGCRTRMCLGLLETRAGSYTDLGLPFPSSSLQGCPHTVRLAWASFCCSSSQREGGVSSGFVGSTFCCSRMCGPGLGKVRRGKNERRSLCVASPGSDSQCCLSASLYLSASSGACFVFSVWLSSAGTMASEGLTLPWQNRSPC